MFGGQGGGPKGLGSLYFPRYFHYNNQLASHAPGAQSFVPKMGGPAMAPRAPAGGGLAGLRPMGGNFMGRGPGGR